MARLSSSLEKIESWMRTVSGARKEQRGGGTSDLHLHWEQLRCRAEASATPSWAMRFPCASLLE
eukprot:11715053-Prorocentrum_lima.AAC.1